MATFTAFLDGIDSSTAFNQSLLLREEFIGRRLAALAGRGWIFCRYRTLAGNYRTIAAG